MPIYEYLCPVCDYRFEALRSMSRASEKFACPKCEHEAERILSTFAFCSVSESGETSAIGGNSCASCSSGSCATCAM